MSKIDQTLVDVRRLYALVQEMREVVGRLKEAEVEVRIRQGVDVSDPINTFAQVAIFLRPGCERIEDR